MNRGKLVLLGTRVGYWGMVFLSKLTYQHDFFFDHLLEITALFILYIFLEKELRDSESFKRFTKKWSVDFGWSFLFPRFLTQEHYI